MNIIPAILVHSSEEYFSQIRQVDHFAPAIHLDILDDTLVPGRSWAEPEAVQDATPCDIHLHLMVNDPAAAAKRWKDVPQATRAIVHAEAPGDTMRAIRSVKKYMKNVWLAVNPETPSAVLDRYLHACDGVLFMTIRPGAQGNPFIPSVVEKIANFHHEHPGIPVAADGHVDEDTIPLLAKAGVSECCAGSSIFHADAPPDTRYAELSSLAASLTKE